MQSRNRPGDQQIAALAARQHGVVAHRQLTRLGLRPGAIKHRLAIGRLHRLHIGVYAVGQEAITTHGRWMAAVLAGGPGAVLSHLSAAALWGLRPSSRARIDVIAPRTRGGRPGIALHRARTLHPQDRIVLQAIPVTTVARTLLDVSEILPGRDLERAFEAAERLQVLDMRAAEVLWRRSRGRRGLRPLGELIAEQRPPVAPTRSDLERRFLDLCREAGLPRPAVNVRVAGLEVDMLWNEQRLVVELDGHAFHHTRAAFERDRTRDATLQLAGYRVLRITHRRLEAEPAATTTILRSLLASG